MNPYRDPPDGPKRPCPRCTANLEGILVGEREVLHCAPCRGLWLPPAVFNDALVEPGLQAELARLDHVGAYQNDDGSVLFCPVCNKAMRRAEYAGRSRVIVDGCRVHGIWLDPSELARIIEYVNTNIPSAGAMEPKAPATINVEALHGLRLGPIGGGGFWDTLARIFTLRS